MFFTFLTKEHLGIWVHCLITNAGREPLVIIINNMLDDAQDNECVYL